MKKFALAQIIAACLIAALTTPASAQPGWVLIGEHTVNRGAERDSFIANAQGAFRRIRVCAYRRPVRFYDLDVIYGNGRRHDIRIRRRINPGTCTRAIDLRGNRRFIRRVVTRYETIGRGPRAIVRVFGRR